MLWICRGCTTAYSVGAPKCPHCGGSKYVKQGSKEHDALLDAATEPVAAQEPEVTADA